MRAPTIFAKEDPLMKGAELRRFIEQAPVAMALLDRDLRYIAASPRWLRERKLGSGILGRSVFDVFPDLRDEKWREVSRRALAGEVVIREDDQLTLPHGDVQWVRTETRPWRDENGDILGIVAYVEDITPRKKAEKSLRESEERYRFAIEATSDGIWDWNLRTDEASYSPSYYTMLGYDASDWGSGSLDFWKSLLHPDDRDRVAAMARHLIEAHGFYSIEFRMRAKDGSYRWIMSRGKVVERDESGAPVRAVGTHVDIHERKTLEEALRRSEAKAREKKEELEWIYNNAPIGLCFFDRELRYLRVNRHLAAFGGLTPEQLVGRTLEETAPAIAASARVAMQEILASRKPLTNREIVAETPSQPGAARHFRESWYPFFGNTGDIRGFGVVVEEITERKKADQALRQSSERLKVAQAVARIGIWDWDLRAEQYWINEEYRRICDLPPGATPSFERFLEQIVPEDRDSYEEIVQDAFAGRGEIDSECRIAGSQDGKIRWLRSRGMVLFEEDGRPRGAIGALWDITALKDAQQSLLQKSEDRYRRIVETLQEGIWLIDADAKTSFVNPKMAQMLGYTTEEMRGRDFRGFMDEEWLNIAAHKLLDRKAGIIETHDFKFRRKDGSELWAVLSCCPIFEEDAYSGALAMVMDFTERKRLQNQIEEHLQVLREADQRKNEFLATLAHELRNPLATINLAIENVDANLRAGGFAREDDLLALGRAIRQGRHLARLVEDLVQVSRITSGKIELRKGPVDLSDLIRDAVDLIRAKVEKKNITLVSDISCEPLPVIGDSVRLIQVFVNLLDNAAKFTDVGGIIKVRAARSGKDAIVEVSDNGIGIPADQLNAIFELFQQMRHGTERRAEGLGIGLALARQLVQLHEGAISAKSEGQGFGSVFTVTLPLDPTARPD
ncbi:PAS domain S-box protein [Methylocystis sp. IM3]|uniref:PAS domain S-box protein n=3 Tax=unclassified Methylocystis TaxID=2625913 RepID=UPI0031195CF0